jgi:hypothetical protein
MSDTQIIDAVRKMAGTYNRELSVMIMAEVISVDLATRSCICNPLSGRVKLPYGCAADGRG